MTPAETPRDPIDAAPLALPSAKGAVDRLMPLLEAELRRLAASRLQAEPAGHTLQPTALVNEAYMRLVSQRNIDEDNRAQFTALAATMFRRILVDHAKRKRTKKRGDGHHRTTLSGLGAGAGEPVIDLLDLDQALERLAKVEPTKSRVVELRYFGGLTLEETAKVLGVSRRRIDKEWAVAKLWLRKQLGEQGAG